MFKKNSVGLEEAMGAIQAMLDEVKNHPEKYWQHGAMAVVDEGGKLIAFAKMDSSHVIPGDMAIRKAWTAALCAQNTDATQAMLDMRNVKMDEFLLGGTPIAGGLVIFEPAEVNKPTDSEEIIPPFKPSCIGAVAVSGVGHPPEDVEVAQVGVNYIRNKLWPNL